MMKKIVIGCLLAFLIEFSYAYDFFAVCSTGQTLYYNILSAGEVEVTYYPFFLGNTTTGVLQIPDSVEFDNQMYAVKSIGNRAFRGCTGLDGGLIIPDNVITIGESAFYNCSGIDTLILGTGVTTIGNSAFRGCTGLDGGLIIPDNVITIGESAFYNCSGIDTLILGTGVTTIGNSAFYGCTGLDGGLIIPDNVITIGESTFYNCRGIDTLILGTGVTTIGNSAFYGCTGLDGGLIIPDNVITIGESTFYNCSGIDTLILGTGVTTIGNSAFYGCTGLDGGLIIPDNVITIGESAFYNCSGIDTLILGVGVTTIGNSAFYGCTGLVGGLIIPDNVTTIGASAFYNCSGIDTLILGTGVTTIGNSAFYGCTGLDGGLIIPDNVTTIGSSAFYSCSGIDTLILGTGVTTIGNRAFQGCTGVRSLYYNARNCTTQLCNGSNAPFYGAIQSGLQVLVIGDSVQSIPSCAFYGCTGLDGGLIIPDNVTAIGSSAFYNCSGIDTLILGTAVATIGNSAFRGCAGLDGGLIIPDNVTTIGEYAFYNCSGIDTLILGTAVATIGNSAFRGCTGVRSLYYNARNCTTQLCNGSNAPFYGAIQSGLQVLVIGDSVQSIPSYAFYGCSELDGGLIIPDNVTTIGEYAFYGCTGLDGALIIPDNVTTIGSSAFYSCSGIDTLILGTGVTTIGNRAFQGCTGVRTLYYNARNCTTQLCNGSYAPFYGAIQSGLQVLVIGDSVQSIPSYAFYNCSGIDTLTIGTGVATIGNRAFQGCTGLDGGLIIPDNVITIGSSAFYNCSGIDTLILGVGVTTIGNSAFQGCTGVRSLYYNAKNCTTQLGYNWDSPFYGAIQSGLQVLVIGDSVQSIPSYAFYNCSGIDTLTIGTGVATIGNSAFRGCAGLDGGLIIPDNVTTIGEYAFYNCSGIDTLILGTAVATIGNSAFRGCTGVRSLYYNARNCTTQLCNGSNAPFYGAIQSGLQVLVIGDSVQSIPSYAFRGCTGLDGGLIIPDNVTTIGMYAFYNCSGIDTLTIGTGVATIGNRAFYGCTGLDGGLIIPDNVTTIGEYAFYNCSGIDTLILGTAVATIGNSAFRGCTGLDGGLIIPHNVITIGESAFSGCSNFYDIQFPATLQSIGNKAFFNCDNLVAITIDSAQVSIGDSAFAMCDRLVTVDLGTRTTSIGAGAFVDCFRLTTVNMGNAVTAIGNNAFQNCIRMVSPKLSNALLTIGNEAFKGCLLVFGQLTIPKNVTEIAAGAYSGCSGITSIKAKPLNPPTIYATTFDSVNTNIPVYVPCGKVLDYFITDYWENFSSILENEPYQVNLSVNNEAMGSVIQNSAPTCNNPQSIVSAIANDGFHFVRWNDGNTNNPRVLMLNQDTSLVAHFTINQAYITVHSNDSVKGHVSGSGLYMYNAPVVLMATANQGYHFIQWSDGNTQNPRYVVAKQDSVFTAVFVSNVSNITVYNNNPEMGNVSGSGIYYYQNYATISATPNYGYHFTHWNDGNTDNPRLLFVDRDTSFTASFALNMYSISATSENSSMGTVTGGGNYTYNMQISLGATANYGYHFSQWSDGNTQNPRTVIVNKDSSFTAQFAANIYTLSVSSNDPDMGSAYGAGTFTYNSQTTISAAPNYGYHFLQWSDGNTDNPRIVTVNGNREYVAVFAINFYTITVNSSNPALGSASGGGSYNYNSNISISATPNYGYHFTQWSDGNTQNPRNVTVMQNATYTAQFAINNYAVTVNSNNDHMGVVLGSGSYIYNTPATISATPNYGYHFVQWSDGSTENPRTFIVTQDRVFSAQFDYNTYMLTALSNNYLAGNVVGGGVYDYSTVVSVNAIPNEHYHFVQWSDMITDNPRNITMTKDTMVTAEFAIDVHSVFVQSSSTAMGSVMGGGECEYGATIHLLATPNYGYHFVQWSDGNTQNPRIMTVDQDLSLTAVFDYNQYEANIQSSDTAKGAVSGFGVYPYMTEVTIQALPVTGYHFTQWGDGVTENPRTFTLTQDTLIMAHFAINMYTVNIHSNDTTMGNVSGAGTFPYQMSVTVSATASEHHHFVQWDDGSTSNPRQIQVLADISLTAIFEEDDRFMINALCSDTTMGQVLGGGEYYAGMSTTLTAVPNDHYQFEYWIDGSTENPRTITVLEDATFIAVFTPISYDILAYSANEMLGTVTGTGTYQYLSSVMLEAVANEGCHFVCWNDGNTDAVRTVLVEGNAVYIATFADGVGIEGQQDEVLVKVYPNPTQESVCVEGVCVIDVKVFDMQGKCVDAIVNDNSILMSTLPVGVYLLRINALEGIFERKIIKK